MCIQNEIEAHVDKLRAYYVCSEKCQSDFNDLLKVREVAHGKGIQEASTS